MDSFLKNYTSFDLNIDYRGVLDRIKAAYKFADIPDTSFIKKFNLRDNAFGAWLQRKSIPFNFILIAAIETNTSLDYLIFGKETNTTNKINKIDKIENLTNSNALIVGGSVLNSTINQNINNELLERINKIEFELLQMRSRLIINQNPNGA